MASDALTYKGVNPLWLSGDMRHWTHWSTLVQVMACCLTASSHYLSQHWLAINETLCHPFHSNICLNTKDIDPKLCLQSHIWNHSTYPKEQWVNDVTRHFWPDLQRYMNRCFNIQVYKRSPSLHRTIRSPWIDCFFEVCYWWQVIISLS